MKVSKTAKVAAAVAAVAIVTAGVNAKKPVPPPPDPGLTVDYELLGADYDDIFETGGTCGVLVEQQDGKYLVPGIIRPHGVPPQGISQLTRWNVDYVNRIATVDADFGNDSGRFVYDFGDKDTIDLANDAAVQLDGKIVLVGTCNEWFSPWIARLNTDGSLDETFGNLGVVDNIFPNTYSQFATVTILADGSIVAAGRYFDGLECPLLVKFAPDGTLDTSFGQNGVSFINLGGHSIIVSGNGFSEFPVGSGCLIAAGTGPDFATSTIFRFLRDGRLDPYFGNGGLAEIDFEPEGAEFFHALVVQPDGKIVAVGGTSADPSPLPVYHDNWLLMDQFSIARFNPDGTLDKRGFVKRRGGTQLALAPGGNCEFTSVELLSEGKLLAVGCGDPGIDGTRDIYLARFLSNGNLDTSFDQDGWININMMGDETAIGLQVINDRSYLISVTGVDPVFGYTTYLGHVWEE